MQYLDLLNEKQKEAVLCKEGPLLIVAGAGAGKTKTITHRIIHLIHQGIAPENILAVTFTNKAAKEMRDRVENMLNQSIARWDRVPFISTFHSLGVFIIKEHAHLLGLTKHFAILDEHDAVNIIKEVMKERDIDPKQHDPKKIKNVISKHKGDFIDQESYSTSAIGGFQSIVAEIWAGYEKTKRQEKSLDFDDLLLESVKILKKNKGIRDDYQDRFKYIHIDEYQDTNEVQYELTKLLVGENQNICVVGDTDQNIYSWRGANIKNMLHFERDYPSAKIVLLEENYRSSKNIITAANAIISKNTYRMPKTLFTQKGAGESLLIYNAYDEVDEASFVAETIDELLKKVPAEEIAILYRANFQSRIIEESLLSKNIPYQVLGVKFFDRKEVKDLLSYIRASYNRESLSDIRRVINFPARGIGKATLVKLFASDLVSLPSAMQIKIQKFYLLLEDIHAFASSHAPSETIKYVMSKSGIEDELKRGGSEELERLENMMELVTLATKYDKLGNGMGLEKLLEDASLASDQDSMLHAKGTGVRMMTVHAAKGLEFDHLFITGLEDGLFPHERSTLGKNDSDREEERRLFYVAITRARHKLYLSHTELRTIFGSKKLNTPSEFIYDIPSELTTLEQGRSRRGEKVIYI
jgi:DNA helicase II / ATP-dependent DNA helicase PcrA